MSVTRVCLYCGVEFEGNPKANYCTTSHRVLDYRKRNGLPVTPFKQTDQIQALNELVATLSEENALLRAELSNRPSADVFEPIDAGLEPMTDPVPTKEGGKGKKSLKNSPVEEPDPVAEPAPVEEVKKTKKASNKKHRDYYNVESAMNYLENKSSMTDLNDLL